MLQQSGVIPYRIRDGEVEILLVKTSSGKAWTIPKGWIPWHMTSAQSAAKEAWEEAGVIGVVMDVAIASYTTRKLGCVFQVEVFLMLITEEYAHYPEAMQRQRQWMSIADAIQHVEKKKLKKILRRIKQQEGILGIDSSEVLNRSAE